MTFITTLKKFDPDNEKRYTLRYKATAPFDNRPHDSCVARFVDAADAYAHLEEQENAYDLEVVRR